MGHKEEFGCLMAVIDPIVGSNIIKYGKEMIPDSNLYFLTGDDGYGRDDEPHVTLKYGFSKDLTDSEIKDIIVQ